MKKITGRCNKEPAAAAEFQEPFSGLTSHLLDPAEGSQVSGGGRLLEQLMEREEREGGRREGEPRTKAGRLRHAS